MTVRTGRAPLRKIGTAPRGGFHFVTKNLLSIASRTISLVIMWMFAPTLVAETYLLNVECTSSLDTLVHVEIEQKVRLRDGSDFDPSPPDPIPICQHPYLFVSDGQPLSMKFQKHSGPNADITRVTLRPQPLGDKPVPPTIFDNQTILKNWEWQPADRYFTLFDGQYMHLAVNTVSMRRCSDVCEPDTCFPNLVESEPFRIKALPLKYPNVNYGYHCGGGHGNRDKSLLWDRVDKCCADHDAGHGGRHPKNFCGVKDFCDTQTEFYSCLDTAFAVGEAERARQTMKNLIGPLLGYCNDLTKAAAWVSCQF